VFLLRPQALGPGVNGQVLDVSDPSHRLDFRYRLVRVWEIPFQALLSAGLGTLPLAPISAVGERELPTVIDAMKRRLEQESQPTEARELWTATRVLMGLRWAPQLTADLLRGVQGMKESTTYQEIVQEGREEGRIAGAREILLDYGTKHLGAPTPSERASINAIHDLQQLKDLFARIDDGSVGTWSELLASVT